MEETWEASAVIKGISDLKMLTTQQYETAIRRLMGDDMRVAVQAARELGQDRCVAAEQCLLTVLEKTDEHALRDATAIALADMGSHEGKIAILRKLKDVKTINHRGSLLYALSCLDCADVISDVMGFVFEDNFEVSRQALLVLQAIQTPIPFGAAADCRRRLKKEIASARGEKKAFLQEAEAVLNRLSENA
jgi:hypothetical protein